MARPKLLLGKLLEIIRNYKANRRDPTIVNIPIPMPRIVGQSVPDCGRAGWAGIAVGVFVVSVVDVAVGVGVVVAQTQFDSPVQDVFLQLPVDEPDGI